MADKSQIMDALEALAVHCRPPLMSVEDRTRWMRDWVDDLAEYPLEAVTNGTRKWRHSGSVKFPTAGQLLPMVREGLARPDTGPSQPWRPATEAEYTAMSIRGKIHEQTILAHEAAGKAGPMFRNTTQGPRMSGVHLTADEMPPAHAHWRQVAANHMAEVKRLRQYVNGNLAISAA